MLEDQIKLIIQHQNMHVHALQNQLLEHNTHLNQHDESIYWLSEFRSPHIKANPDILLSIIMPTYNRANFIETAIQQI